MNLAVLRARLALSADFSEEERDYLLYAIRLSAVMLLCQAHEKETALTREGQGLKGAHGRRA